MSGQNLILTDRVLAHFAQHRQRRFFDSEAGGQLFARFKGADTWIEQATGPRSTDKRSRAAYQADRRAEQKEILAQHDASRHYVGDWHTHPVQRPHPSSRDLATIAECVQRSQHGLNAFVLVIVGTAPAPKGLSVSLHNGMQHAVLSPVLERVAPL